MTDQQIDPSLSVLDTDSTRRSMSSFTEVPISAVESRSSWETARTVVTKPIVLTGPVTLTIKWDKIHATVDSDMIPASKPLFDLSHPLLGSGIVFAIEQNIYTVGQNGQRKRRQRHLYDVSTKFDVLDMHITGKSKFSYPSAVMKRRVGIHGKTWTVYTGLPYSKDQQKVFSSRPRLKLQSKDNAAEVEWRDPDGKVIAIGHTEYEIGDSDESRSQSKTNTRSVEDKLHYPPEHLEVVAPLGEKLLGLLIICWCTSIWKANSEANKEPLTLQSVKERLTNHTWTRGGWNLNGTTGLGSAGSVAMGAF